MINNPYNRAFLAALLLIAAPQVACVAEEDLAGEDEPSTDTIDQAAYFAYPDVTTLRKKCGEFYALAGWSFLINSQFQRTCVMRTPAGDCITQDPVNGVYFDAKNVQPYHIIPAMEAAFKECTKLSLNTPRYGSCPSPDYYDGNIQFQVYYNSESAMIAHRTVVPNGPNNVDHAYELFQASRACGY